MKTSFLRVSALFPLLALTFSSCLIGTVIAVPRQVPFHPADFAGYDQPGTGSISGRVSTRDDHYQYISSGEEVGVIPVTPYTTETVKRELGHGERLTRSDGRLARYAHYGKTDRDGYFTVTGLPPGRYYVIGSTHWPNATGDDEYANIQWSCEQVTLAKGQALKLDVTHNPQIGNAITQDGFASGL
ncbi:MAG TPA: carboxypeptidase-like regulatory domain-containing protein [Chthoniobacter sp.]|nr:carboxypeptidase-like regulatory domain-containing protein [Chthoniobacter sp.]